MKQRDFLIKRIKQQLLSLLKRFSKGERHFQYFREQTEAQRKMEADRYEMMELLRRSQLR